MAAVRGCAGQEGGEGSEGEEGEEFHCERCFGRSLDGLKEGKAGRKLIY